MDSSSLMAAFEYEAYLISFGCCFLLASKLTLLALHILRQVLQVQTKKKNQAKLVLFLWCGREDLNLHECNLTST
jgi:hypothetical protein